MHYFSVSATAKACKCVYICIYMHIYIYSAYIDGSIISPWHLRYTEMQFLMRRYPQGSRIQAARNLTFQKSKNPKIKKSKNLKIQKSKTQKTMQDSVDVISFRFWEFLDF